MTKRAKAKPRVGLVMGWPDNISNGDVARGTGLSRTLVSRIRSGQRTPSLRSAELIANYLGLPLSEFTAQVRKRQGMSAPRVD